MKLGMNHNRHADLLGIFYGVFSSALAVRRNEGMKNIRVFSNQSVTGIKSLSENVAG